MKTSTALLLVVVVVPSIGIGIYSSALHQRTLKEEQAKWEAEAKESQKQSHELDMRVLADMDVAHKEVNDWEQTQVDQAKTLGQLQLTDAQREKKARMDAALTKYIRTLQDHWYDLNDDIREGLKGQFQADKQAIEDSVDPAVSSGSH